MNVVDFIKDIAEKLGIPCTRYSVVLPEYCSTYTASFGDWENLKPFEMVGKVDNVKDIEKILEKLRDEIVFISLEWECHYAIKIVYLRVRLKNKNLMIELSPWLLKKKEIER